MMLKADNLEKEQRRAAAHTFPKARTGKYAFPIEDNRPKDIIQRISMQHEGSTGLKRPGTFNFTDNRPRQHLPIQKKENNTGLPDQIKTGIETLSGYAMDDVKVHYNSGKPAQLQAHAFAQGTNIHIAPGQEKHLPHEAWHVIQQKQGRVKPTIQLKGNIAINDSTELEREADIMGQKALSAGSASGSLTAAAGSPDSDIVNQRKVFQLTSSQIDMNPDGNTIKQIIIRGRPPRTFSGSMGDHTTAFVIHTEGLNIALLNQPLKKAIEILNGLVSHLKELPGYNLMNESSKELFNQEFSILKENLQGAQTFFAKADQGSMNENSNESPDHEFSLSQENLADAQVSFRDPDQIIQHLQQAISAYLDARELIPFSTINVSMISQGKAGKGHAESGSIAILSTYERKVKEGAKDGLATQEQLIHACEGLFDFQSAGMLATANKDTAETMSTGTFKKEETMKTKMELIWKQHSMSVEKMFPNVFKVVGSDLQNVDLLDKLEKSKISSMTYLMKDIHTRLNALKDLILKFTTDHILSVATKNLSQVQLALISNIYKEEELICSWLPKMNELNDQLEDKTKFIGDISKVGNDLKIIKQSNPITPYSPEEHDSKLEIIVNNQNDRITKGIAEGTSTRDAETIIGHVEHFKKGDPLKKLEPAASVSSAHIPAVAPSKRKSTRAAPVPSSHIPAAAPSSSSTTKKSNSGKAPVSETMTSGMNTMSVQIKLAPNGVVTNMLSNGRPPSPFKEGMGAHTTAWVVHLDRVENRIRGKTINDAIEEIKHLIDEIRGIEAKQANKTWGDNVGLHHGNFNNALKNFSTLDPKFYSIVNLQNMISAALSLYNLIPGVSRDGKATTGNAEGTHRKVLLDYEKFDKGTIVVKIKAELSAYLKSVADKGSVSSSVSKPAVLNEIEKTVNDTIEISLKNQKSLSEKDIEQVIHRAISEKIKSAIGGLYDGGNSSDMRDYHYKTFIKEAYPKSHSNYETSKSSNGHIPVSANSSSSSLSQEVSNMEDEEGQAPMKTKLALPFAASSSSSSQEVRNMEDEEGQAHMKTKLALPFAASSSSSSQEVRNMEDEEGQAHMEPGHAPAAAASSSSSKMDESEATQNTVKSATVRPRKQKRKEVEPDTVAKKRNDDPVAAEPKSTDENDKRRRK